jgi:hypothetical protein
MSTAHQTTFPSPTKSNARLNALIEDRRENAPMVQAIE